jgi:hypothetical protein
MAPHYPLDQQPFRTLYYVRGDEKTVGGSYCVSSKGTTGFNEQCTWNRESQHNPRTVAPQYGLAVKAALRPHADRIAVAGGVAIESHAMSFGYTPVARAAVDIPDVAQKQTTLVTAFQESRYFKQTTEQLRLAGRMPNKTTNGEYGKNAYGVRAHVAVPWISKIE